MNIQSNPAYQAISGMNQGFERLAENTQKITHPESGQQAQALIDNTQAARQVESSAKALKTYDEMIGSLLDVTA